MSALRFKVAPGDVPAGVAARRLGLSLAQFEEALPRLLACTPSFPKADPITGNFDLDAIEVWSAIESRSAYGRMRAAGLNCRPDLVGRGFVYFIRGGELVKIGRAIDPFRRVADLQLGSPARLSLICAVPGYSELELTLHEKFASDRRHGEWFFESDLLAAYVARCATLGFAADVGFAEDGTFIIPPLAADRKV